MLEVGDPMRARRRPSLLPVLSLILFACGGSTFGTAAVDSGTADVSPDSSATADAANRDGSMLDASGVDATMSETGVSDRGGISDVTSVDVVSADSGGGPCMGGGVCGAGLTCCGSSCVNETNDPLNCGTCQNECQAPKSMCLGRQCVVPTCLPSCGAGQSCCEIQVPGPSLPPMCVNGPTCPVGCPLCQ
jgi:hypothetical protein